MLFQKVPRMVGQRLWRQMCKRLFDFVNGVSYNILFYYIVIQLPFIVLNIIDACLFYKLLDMSNYYMSMILLLFLANFSLV